MERERSAVVETCGGRIRGTREDGLHVFRGVPYAEPPLRWRPPRPAKPWTGVRDADRFGPPAPQNPSALSALLGTTADAWSEDCLTLNVWTPGLDGARRPVMVWIHGGGFTTGASSLPIYDGAGLARRGDTVVVTFNYRLGALGYLALPPVADEEGGCAGNFGLLDQIAALEWVREHAVALGGDPEQVTVFGESAGAMSIGTLLGCPGARGLFRRAILQSGAASNVSSLEEAEVVARGILDELGLGPRDLARLRELPVEAILGAQQRLLARRIGGVRLLAFQPVHDGRVLPRQPLEAIAEGSAASVSVVAGTNLDEYKLWSLTDRRARSLDEEGLLRRLRRNVPGKSDGGEAHAERALAIYRRAGAERGSSEPRELWFAIESDRIFRIPATRLLERLGAHAEDVRAYLFTWRSPVLDGALGACHGLEVPFVFGQVRRGRVRSIVGGSEAAQALSERMQDAWLAFARSGDPRHADLPEWPCYDVQRRATLLLDRECRVGHAPLEEQRRFWDGLL